MAGVRPTLLVVCFASSDSAASTQLGHLGVLELLARSVLVHGGFRLFLLIESGQPA
jgi:hypothetical protein